MAFFAQLNTLNNGADTMTAERVLLNAPNVTVVKVGGGITTPMLLHALQALYLGGLYIDETITQESIPAGEGAARLAVVTPRYYASHNTEEPNPTFGETVIRLGSELASFDAAYNFFLTNTAIALSKRLFLWIDAESENDAIATVQVCAGGDGPSLHYRHVSKSDPVPNNAFFFSERALRTSPSTNPFGP